MNILVGKHPATLVMRFGNRTFEQRLGILVSPRMVPDARWLCDSAVVWAADNDCFQGLNRAAFIAMLKRLAPYAAWCKFVAVPDVVGDAAATLARFALWLPVLRYFGLPVALVAQDGLERLPAPWGDFDALFIGGSTAWKLSRAAADLVREAKARGKHVHMGRANSRRRVAYAASLGCDTVDGSGHARFTERMLPLALQGAANYSTSLEGFL